MKAKDKYNKSMFITICGSYRRELPTSSDIDILLCDLDIITMDDIINSNINYLSNYVNYLRDNRYIVDDITDKNIKTKYMGFCRLNDKSKIRRIDIRFIPMESYFTALLYFTGSFENNKIMRKQAKKLGYKLNEKHDFQLTFTGAPQWHNQRSAAPTIADYLKYGKKITFTSSAIVLSSNGLGSPSESSV